MSDAQNDRVQHFLVGTGTWTSDRGLYLKSTQTLWHFLLESPLCSWSLCVSGSQWSRSLIRVGGGWIKEGRKENKWLGTSFFHYFQPSTLASSSLISNWGFNTFQPLSGVSLFSLLLSLFPFCLWLGLTFFLTLSSVLFLLVGLILSYFWFVCLFFYLFLSIHSCVSFILFTSLSFLAHC